MIENEIKCPIISDPLKAIIKFFCYTKQSWHKTKIEKKCIKFDNIIMIIINVMDIIDF